MVKEENGTVRGIADDVLVAVSPMKVEQVTDFFIEKVQSFGGRINLNKSKYYLNSCKARDKENYLQEIGMSRGYKQRDVCDGHLPSTGEGLIFGGIPIGDENFITLSMQEKMRNAATVVYRCCGRLKGDKLAYLWPILHYSLQKLLIFHYRVISPTIIEKVAGMFTSSLDHAFDMVRKQDPEAPNLNELMKTMLSLPFKKKGLGLHNQISLSNLAFLAFVPKHLRAQASAREMALTYKEAALPRQPPLQALIGENSFSEEKSANDSDYALKPYFQHPLHSKLMVEGIQHAHKHVQKIFEKSLISLPECVANIPELQASSVIPSLSEIQKECDKAAEIYVKSQLRMGDPKGIKPESISFHNRPETGSFLQCLGIDKLNFDDFDIAIFMSAYLGLPITAIKEFYGYSMGTGLNKGKVLDPYGNLLKAGGQDGTLKEWHDAILHLLATLCKEAGVSAKPEPNHFKALIVQEEDNEVEALSKGDVPKKSCRGINPDLLIMDVETQFAELKVIHNGTGGSNSRYHPTKDGASAVNRRAKTVLKDYYKKAHKVDQKYYRTEDGKIGPTEKELRSFGESNRFKAFVVGEYGELSDELLAFVKDLAVKKSERAELRGPKQVDPVAAYPTILWDFRRRISQVCARYLCDVIKNGLRFLDSGRQVVNLKKLAGEVQQLQEERAAIRQMERSSY